MNADPWKDLVDQLRFSGTREGDRVLIDAPDDSHGKAFNGQEGTVAFFEGGWVYVQLPRAKARFRADELKVL